MKAHAIGCCLALVCISRVSFPQLVLTLTDESDTYSLNGYVAYLEDPSGLMTIESVRSNRSHEGFTFGQHLNFGFSSSAYWIRWTVRNEAHTDVSWALELMRVHLDSVDFFWPGDETGISRSRRTGSMLPFQNRENDFRTFVFELDIPSGAERTYYMRVRSETSVGIPLRIRTMRALVAADEFKALYLGFYIGMLVILMIYNSMMSVSLRDLTFFYYVGFLFSMFLLFSLNKGLFNQFIGPSTGIFRYAYPLGLLLTNITILLSLRSFISIQRQKAWVHRAMRVMLVVASVSILFFALFGYRTFHQAALLMLLPVVGVTLISGIAELREGSTSVRLFVLGWPLAGIGGIMIVLSRFDILHFGEWVEEAPWVGILLLSILWAFANLARIRTIVEERHSALRESGSRFLTLAQSTFEGILISENGTIVDANEQMAALLGYDLWEVIGQKTLDFVDPASRDRVQQSLEADVSGPYEYSALRKDRSQISLEARDRTIQYKGRRARMSAVRDLTERIRAERERQVLEQQLFHAQKFESIGTLASGIAHDFNNILNIISAGVFLIEENTDDAPKVRSRLASITSATQRGVQLVRQLLTYARKTESNLQHVSINELVRETTKLLQDILPRNVDVRLDLTADRTIVQGDPNQLHQVLLNLCVNARDAMVQGGTLRVETECLRHSGGVGALAPTGSSDVVRIRVVDSGMGMDEATRSKIFDPFFTTKESGKGTGLGLAVVTGIVENHKGNIEVQSEPGRGTEFHVYLPLMEDGGKSTKPLEKARPSTKGGCETILLAEDEPLARDLVSQYLRSKGYNVLTAADGEEASAILEEREDPVSLLITDLGLPKCDGEALTRTVKLRDQSMPVIVVSGFIEPKKLEALSSLGVDEVMQKPYSMGELQSRVRTILDKRYTAD